MKLTASQVRRLLLILGFWGIFSVSAPALLVPEHALKAARPSQAKAKPKAPPKAAPLGKSGWKAYKTGMLSEVKQLRSRGLTFFLPDGAQRMVFALGELDQSPAFKDCTATVWLRSTARQLTACQKTDESLRGLVDDFADQRRQIRLRRDEEIARQMKVFAARLDAWLKRRRLESSTREAALARRVRMEAFEALRTASIASDGAGAEDSLQTLTHTCSTQYQAESGDYARCHTREFNHFFQYVHPERLREEELRFSLRMEDLMKAIEGS